MGRRPRAPAFRSRHKIFRRGWVVGAVARRQSRGADPPAGRRPERDRPVRALHPGSARRLSVSTRFPTAEGNLMIDVLLSAREAMAAGEARVGGKAIGLARLTLAGVAVPDWQVVPVAA